jgi:hypothetical protein
MHTELDDLPSDVQRGILSLGWLVWLAGLVLAIWSALIAFGGGELPLTGIEVTGGTGTGLLWALFAAPTIVVIGHCCSVALISLCALLAGLVCPVRRHDNAPHRAGKHS